VRPVPSAVAVRLRREQFTFGHRVLYKVYRFTGYGMRVRDQRLCLPCEVGRARMLAGACGGRATATTAGTHLGLDHALAHLEPRARAYFHGDRDLGRLEAALL
jgi:hypothetical protein